MTAETALADFYFTIHGRTAFDTDGKDFPQPVIETGGHFAVHTGQVSGGPGRHAVAEEFRRPVLPFIRETTPAWLHSAIPGPL